MTRRVPIAAAFLMLAACGIVHGIWTKRWGASREFQTALAQLENLPMNLGEWRGRPLTMNEDELALAEVMGYVARVYRHPTKGEASVFVLCGRPGPISLHTPDVCFPGIGFQVTGDPEPVRVPLNDEQARLLMLRLRKPGPIPEVLRVYWSWNPGSGWTVPANPRLAFAHNDHLYKLYVVRRPAKPDEPVKDDASLDLLRRLLPELEKHLAPA